MFLDLLYELTVFCYKFCLSIRKKFPLDAKYSKSTGWGVVWFILCFDKVCQDRRMPDAVYIIYCQILASVHYELHINWDWVYRAQSIKLRDHDNFLT